MADQSFEPMPEVVDALPDTAPESVELATPLTLKEEPATTGETADTSEEMTETPKKKTNNGRTRSIEQKGAAKTPEERADQQPTNLNGADPTTPPQAKKTPARKRTKATSTTPEAATISSEPQATATAQPTEPVELVAQATDGEPIEAPVTPAEPVNLEHTGLETSSAIDQPEVSALEHVETSIAPAEAIAQISEDLPETTSPTEEAQEPVPPVEPETIPASPEEQEEAEIFIEVLPAIEDAATIPAGIMEKSPVVVEETSQTTSKAERGHLVRSAALVSIGNLGSSLLGMVRQVIVTGLGPSIAGPFNAALSPVNNFYQLLVNGSTDGALIPVFNEYTTPEKKEEGRRVIFTVVNLILIIAVIASVGYFFLAPSFVNLLVSGYAGADKTLTLHFSQFIFFSMIVLGPFAVLLAALFSLKIFGWPAFATAAYHAGIILGAAVATIIGLNTWGIIALPIGLLIGAAGQIVLLLPGIRQHKLYYRLVLDLKHPALKRIYRLYWPIAISYVFSSGLVFWDLYLQSWTPQKTAGTTAMAAATTLIQFPIGLVAQALAIAVLPTLSEHARANNSERFKETIQLGIRLGLLLMIPAMIGLIFLRTPIMYLIFAHHNYTLGDANIGALALQNYAYQLPFVVVDQLLIAAFYARKNTLVPVLVGIASIAFYAVVALPTYSHIGVAGLAFANTVQNSSHAIILLIILRIWIGPLNLRKTVPSVLKICVSAALMGLAAWLAMYLLGQVSVFSLSHVLGQFLTFIVAGSLATIVYFVAVWFFKVEEIGLIKGIVRKKVGNR